MHHKSTFPRSFSLCPVMYNFWVPFPIPQISYNLFFSEVGDVLNLLSVSFIFCIRVSLLLLNFIFPIYCVSSLIWFKCFVFDATVFQVVVVFLSCYFLHCVFFFCTEKRVFTEFPIFGNCGRMIGWCSWLCEKFGLSVMWWNEMG